MQESVFDTFPSFSTEFEGRVEHMYQDILGLVSIGIGNLIDPMALAMEVQHQFGPFVFHQGGSPASDDDVVADFTAIKSDPSLAAGGHNAARPIAQLDLPNAGIDALVASKARTFADTLTQTPEFSDVDSWPGDAQLALLSMAWALGPAFGPGWPSFRAACAAHDWTSAAENSHIQDVDNPGVRPRNVANRTLFRNATYAEQKGLDLTVVWFTVSGERPAIKFGSSGADVEFLQERLQTLNYGVDVTGDFDQATVDATMRFQADAGLDADGVVGVSSWAALGTVVPAGG